MIKLAISILAAQATVISPPTSGRQAGAGTSWAYSAQASKPIPSGTVDHPTLVDDSAIGTPEATVRHGRQAQESAARKGEKTYLPSIATIASPGCHKVADYPHGYELASSSMLNGRATIFQCSDFVVYVGVRDLSHPLKVDTAEGFPKSAQKAVLNGGALTYWFRQSTSGIRQAAFIWVGKGKFVEIGLDTRDASLATLSAAGNAIVNGLTRSH